MGGLWPPVRCLLPRPHSPEEFSEVHPWRAPSGERVVSAAIAEVGGSLWVFFRVSLGRHRGRVLSAQLGGAATWRRASGGGGVRSGAGRGTEAPRQLLIQEQRLGSVRERRNALLGRPCFPMPRLFIPKEGERGNVLLAGPKRCVGRLKRERQSLPQDVLFWSSLRPQC